MPQWILDLQSKRDNYLDIFRDGCSGDPYYRAKSSEKRTALPPVGPVSLCCLHDLSAHAKVNLLQISADSCCARHPRNSSTPSFSCTKAVSTEEPTVSCGNMRPRWTFICLRQREKTRWKAQTAVVMPRFKVFWVPDCTM